MFMFGTIGIFAREISIPSSTLAFIRGFIGAFFLLMVLRLRHHTLSVEAVKKNGLRLILSGIFIGLNWIFLFEAYRYTTIAVATLCYYCAPILVMLLSPFVFKEKLNRTKILCIAMAFLGMAFVSGVLQEESLGVMQYKGVAFGLAAATAYALIMLNGKKIHGISSYDMTIVQFMVAAVVIFPYVLLTTNVEEMTLTPQGIFCILVIGTIHTGLCYVWYFSALRQLKAQTVAMWSYIDPLVAVFLSAFLLREPMSILCWIGAALILGATFISELSKSESGQ